MTTGTRGSHAALERVVRATGDPEVVERLAALPGTDLTTLLLEVTRRQAEQRSPAHVLRAYDTDRFVVPGTVSPAALREAEAAVRSSLPSGFEEVVLAPVTPLATHRALGAVDQRKVLTTVRGTEVAADPTNALALEAATRRAARLRAVPRSPEPVRLVACQRVVRAQRFTGPDVPSHFGLAGLVTAGRDTGHRRFERDALVEHVGVGVRACLARGADRVEVALTDLTDGGWTNAPDMVAGALDDLPGVTVVADPDRQAGRDYYRSICFKVHADLGDGPLEIGDGGDVRWTAALLANRKERLLISGMGLDRLASGHVPAAERAT